ncbi:RNA polymerase sigma-B factor [Streptomyces sp. HB202]|nr:RNA polymerase sigma-B factor [Streptomyces sp. HB202]
MTVHTAETAQTAGAERTGTTEELPWIEDAGKIAPLDARRLSRLFFDRLQVLEEGTHEYQYARNTLIEMNLSLVRFAANRFRNRGSGDMEDIVQVGTIGLIKAIDRFDLSREVEFTSFAVPYIVGEIKRFFRDTSWAVHVPRRLQELRVDLAKAKESLAGELDRDPTAKELAEYLGLEESEVTEGIVASNGYTAGSLDMPTDTAEAGPGQSAGRTFADVLGDPDPAMEARGESPRPRAPAGRAGRAGAPDHRHALRPGDDPGADRRGARDIADARVPAAEPDAGQAAERDARPGVTTAGANSGQEGCCGSD